MNVFWQRFERVGGGVDCIRRARDWDERVLGWAPGLESKVSYVYCGEEKGDDRCGKSWVAGYGLRECPATTELCWACCLSLPSVVVSALQGVRKA